MCVLYVLQMEGVRIYEDAELHGADTPDAIKKVQYDSALNT